MSTHTTESENREIVRRLFDEFDEHNLDVVDELLAEEYTTGIYRSGTEEAIEGREGMKDLFQEYREAFPDLRGTSLEMIAEGDRVAVFREERGTHEGEFRGIAPTGKEITFEYGGYFTVEDGKIVHGHLRGNIMSLLKQLDVELPIPT